EVPYVKNKIEGEVVEYWPSGKLKSKMAYKKGSKTGESLGFFEEGALAWNEDYMDDRLRSGVYYNRAKDLISEVQNGGGFAARFDEDQLTLIEYRIGLPEGSVRTFNAHGELQKSLFIKNGMKHGEEVEYFLPSALPKLSIHWNENRIHGCVKTWYDNGKLQSQREYSRNQRMGPSLAWYRDGSLMLYEEYEEDRLVSGQYYKLQKKEPVSTVANGNGLATLFDDMGAFLRKVHYLKGKPFDPEE
ncbi:MAG: hypothetical protein KGI83_05945, partial [Verrucomicrobiota bacterium]|nr:hypothetical protein [Verrucomicrobiota bacterium]